MQFITLASGDHSGIEEPREAIVRTAAQWSALWKEHAGTDAPPAVDFSRFMVIGVFAGSRPTAGYGIEITGIERRDGRLVVTYREQRPAPDAMVAQVLTSPFQIVRTDRHAGRVTFERSGDSSKPFCLSPSLFDLLMSYFSVASVLPTRFDSRL